MTAEILAFPPAEYAAVVEAARGASDANPAATEADTAKRLRLTPASLPADLLAREFPDRAYSWGRYTPLGTTSALVAEGKTGKSTLSLQRQLAIAAGRDLFGFGVAPGLAVYVSCEDPADEVHRRAQKILRDFEPAEARLALERFRVIDAVGLGLRFVTVDRGGSASIGLDVALLADAIRSAAAGAPVVDVAIDTVSRVNGGEENSNAVMAALEAAGARLAGDLGAAVVFLHHTGKAAAREAVADHLAGRGASSFGDNCRSVLRLLPATPDMARGVDGVPPDALAAGDVLRLVHAALNFDRRTPDVWLLRRPDGLLERIATRSRSAASIAEDRLARFLEWWAAGPKQPFTRNAVSRKHRADIWGPGMPVSAAEAFVDRYGKDGLIVPAGTSKGHPAFVVNDVTAPALLAKATAAERAASADWMDS